ncbi:MAG: hypothetical protein FJZ01_04050 [Candidatus Sericytochromatia bacterium]|nr:hypothetical protein [Candidatus Tanganyikabacteria bacterium]
MRIAGSLVRLGWLVAFATSSCANVTAGADKRWPQLVVIWGKASVPAAYATAALETRPARGLAIRLAGYGREPWDAVAVGRVGIEDGRFSLSVPEDQLQVETLPYEAQALDPTGRVLLASPVGLARGAGRVERDLDPATTIVAVAARRGVASGRRVAAWDVAALAGLPEVKAAAERLYGRPAAQALPTTPSPPDDAFGAFAAVPAATEPPELQAAVTAILQNLAAP